MSTEESRKVAADFVASWSTRDADKTVSFVSGLWSDVSIPEPMDTPAMKQYVQGWFTAFPDLEGQAASIVANDDDVAVELTFKGTNTGTLQFNPSAPAMPPSGRVVNGRGTFFGRVQNGKFVELRTYPDLAGMMMQLGMMPNPRS